MKKGISLPLHIALLAAGVGVMALVESVWMPGYWVKSAVKVATFGGLIFAFQAAGHPVLKTCFQKPNKKDFKLALCLFLAVYGVILGAYFVAAPFIDGSSIAASLMGKEGVTLGSFLPVALYISFCNSLLEECYFRGLGYLQLKKNATVPFAGAVSAALFSLYHVFILDGWFSLPLFLLITAALFGAGVFFNAMDRHGSVWPSYAVHMAANFGINTVGVIIMMAK